MLSGWRLFPIIAAVGLIFGAPSTGGADEDQLTGVIVGRTGQVLHISVPRPVGEGTLFAVKLLDGERPIADARVLSCTHERPFLALARITRGDIEQPIPIGVYAYADTATLSNSPGVPSPMQQGRSSNADRFSIQVGAFYPSEPFLRDTVADFWQSYRLSYNMARVGPIDTQISVEYAKGSSAFSEGGQTGTRSMEIIPVTLVGRFRPMRFGRARLFLAAGAGMYRIRSERQLAGAATSTKDTEFGQEFGIGLESPRGWIMELRYRDVVDTSVKGYSFTIGARF